MNLLALLLAALFLHPVLDEPTPLRLVATGTDGHEVAWSVDGKVVAKTADGEAVTLDMPSGDHQVVATTDHDGAWRAMARPDPRPGEGAAMVQGWYAEHPGSQEDPVSGAILWPVVGLAAVGGGLLLWPRRKPKHP